jgi:hypothetical protein
VLLLESAQALTFLMCVHYDQLESTPALACFAVHEPFRDVNIGGLPECPNHRLMAFNGGENVNLISAAANLTVNFTDCPLVKVMTAPVMLSAAPAPLVSNALRKQS